MSFPCVARGRFLVARKYASIDASTNQISDMFGICEIEVYGTRVAGAPSPRAGHAAATIRGMMVVFGGYDNLGNKLNGE